MTQMSIFVLFVSAGILFEGYFSLSVSFLRLLTQSNILKAASQKPLYKKKKSTLREILKTKRTSTKNCLEKGKSGRSLMFFKIGVLKNFTIFTRKHVLESLFNKVACLIEKTLLKRDSNTGVFLWILRIFLKIYFCRTPPKKLSK